MTEDQNVYEFRAEIKKLLDILSKSLYQHQEIFLRELVSNSVDALKKIQFTLLTNRDVVDPDAELKIDILIDEENKQITVSDTGIGMRKKELINDLGTIAGSGTEKFVAALQEMKKEGKEEVDLDTIGQFGIGFYSVFMVAEKVDVITKSHLKDEPAYQWTSDGTGKFTINENDKETRGTDIIIHLNEDGEEFLNQFRIESIIRKYSNFVPFPIYVTELGKEEEEEIEGEKKEGEREEGKEAEAEEDEEEKKEPVNQVQPLWKKKDKDITEEEYKNFYNYIAKRYDDYLDVINYRVDGQVQFRSIMYIPSSSRRDLFMPDTEYGLNLYSKNVMIMENCEELMPRWMRFMTGVLESEDIPLNISRETIQTNRKIIKMRDLLTKKALRELKTLAEKESEKYQTFWEEFSDFIKEGVIQDPANQKKLKELLRFRTTKTEKDKLIGLRDYVDRMNEGQDEIYYLVGENFETMEVSPHLGYYEKEGLEVILFDKPIDNFLMMNISDYSIKEGKGEDADYTFYKFTPIDIAKQKKKEAKEGEESEEKEEEEEVPENVQKFLDKVKDILGEKIIDAQTSSMLYGNPCRLANPLDGPSSSQQRAMRYFTQTQLGEKFEVPKKILEFNPDHPIIKALIELNEKNPDDEKFTPVIEQLFENSLLIEGDLPNPPSMIPRLNKLLELLMTGK